MVHMKALSALFNLPNPKIWIYILRYENTAVSAKISQCCGPRPPFWQCLDGGYRNRIFQV